MRISVKKGKGNFHKKVAELKKLGKQNVAAGHFAEQGQHKTIDMSYVDLMKFHEKGGVSKDGVSSPSRPVMAHMLTWGTKAAVNSKAVRSAFIEWSEGRLSNEGFFSRVGVSMVQVEKGVFGKAGPLLKNARLTIAMKPQGNDPLIDTGDLIDHVAYRTSISKAIKYV